MSGYDDPRVGASSGCGFLLLLLVVTGALGYCHVTRDPTEGLDFRSGDRPEEMPNALCYNDGGRCPPSGFKWTIPAAGAVETQFNLDDPERTELFGAMHLRATYLDGIRVRDCPAVVDWAIAVEGRSIAGNTLRAGGRDQVVTGVSQSGAKIVTLTVRRTDSESCVATLQWNSASTV